MNFTSLILKGAYLIEPEVSEDERGIFYRFFCRNEFESIGYKKPWTQINHSVTKKRGTIRGMHLQIPPHSEIKMIKCINGKIMDIIVDLRSGSETFLQWVGLELSAENKRMVYIPEGFAHGFQSLTDECELIYHHSASYVKEFELGIRWNDPLLDIKWPLPIGIISERDQKHPLLSNDFQGIKL
jgi:dTDP-4-dehydrorhamnose 3,5-epimerase